MARLTKAEKELLVRAADFVLAGEWPWEGDGSDRGNDHEDDERDVLIIAARKLRGLQD